MEPSFCNAMRKDDHAIPSTHGRKGPGDNFADMAVRNGLRPVPAAWPTGIAQLGFAVTACERCDAIEVCNDWLARAPKTLGAVPPFCPNAAELRAGKRRD